MHQFNIRDKFTSPLLNPLKLKIEANDVTLRSFKTPSITGHATATQFSKRAKRQESISQSIDMKKYEPRLQKVLLGSILNKIN